MKTKERLDNMNPPAKALCLAVMLLLVTLPLAGAAATIPPSPLAVQGQVFQSDGSPADRGTPVLVENLGNGQVELTATGRGFPPVEQYKNSYKASLGYDPYANQSIRVSALSYGRHAEVVTQIISNEMTADLTMTAVPTDITRLLAVGLLILGVAIFITRKRTTGGRGRRKGTLALVLVAFLLIAGMPVLAADGQNANILDTLIALITDIFKAVTAMITGEGGGAQVAIPQQLDIGGFVFNSSFAEGKLAANGTLVNVSIYFPNGTLEGLEVTYTGKGFPPIPFYYPQYTSSLKGEVGIDTVNVTATNGTHWGYNNSMLTNSVMRLNVSLAPAAPPDTTPPQFSNNTSSIVTVFSETNNSWFNTTWMDNTAVSTVVFELNISGVPVNYTAVQVGNDYFFETIVPAGTYYWISYATDSLGNQNATLITYFTVVQADNPVDLFLNSTNGNFTSVYGNVTNATGVAFRGTALLWRDEQPVNNPEIAILPANPDGHAYKVNTSGNQNYSANSTGLTSYMIITQATPALQVSFLPSGSVAFGTTTTALCNIMYGDQSATLTLERNSTPVATGAGNQSETNLLGAGVYNYTCSYAPSQNFTATVNADNILTVSQSSNPVSLFINGNMDQNVTITYGSTSNATGVSAGGTASLFRDESPVSNPEIDLLGANLDGYAYKVNATGNQNVSTNSTGLTYYLIVNQASASITLLLNGTNGNFVYPQNGIANFTITTAPVNFPVQLWTNFSDGINKQWDGGTAPFTNLTTLDVSGLFNFTAFFAGNQNYTAASATHFANVTAVPPIGPSGLEAILNKTATGEILLNWTSNESNIFNFVIYKTDDFGAGFNFAQIYGTTPASQTNFTDATANFTSERYYIVRANSTDGLQDNNTYVVGKYDLNLYTQWTLTNPETLLVHNDSLDDITYNAIDQDELWRYDANDTLDPYKRSRFFAGFGWIGDFPTAQPDTGYWYLSNSLDYVTTPFNLTITGVVPQSNRQLLLFNGFNLIGLASVASHNLAVLFPNATDMDEAWRYDSNDIMDPYKRSRFFAGYGWFGDFALLNPGRGYWYMAGAAGNFTNSYTP
jgi:hypothetical protein